ncbi:MAG: aminotransferase class V-fold PLP-dependent enzyme [Candidatus Latescibacteria bacterium]|nr:aminotransferase class V-fold PLP-dependent enzyme [bacterium]MBD3423433.1 aminotransferase class V-fold PLP-dependent enzyme [Candidatus Latescibacterota bacterium]
MEDIRKHKEETQCVHASLIPNREGAVVTPIFKTSTFAFKDVDHGARLFRGEEKGYIYTRVGNPTNESVEQAVAVLEGGYDGIGCATGMAAVHLVLGSYLSAGDHVVSSEAVYGSTCTILTEVFTRFGIEVDLVDTSDTGAVEKAIKPETKLIYVETPANPTLVVSDIAAIAELAHEKGIKFCVDNTFMSPVLQKPLALGADIVLHSMTKFLNGHADVVAGMVVAKTEEDYKHMRSMATEFGGTIDPFNSFLVARGIKTLSIRMEKHCHNAQKLAEYLESHPKVEKVLFPGLPSHPQYEVQKKQTTAPGALISFFLKGGLEAGKKLMNSVKLHTLAVSLGGVESLIQHPASMTHSNVPPEDREKAGIGDGLVRISVGIENVEELVSDLKQGLEKV